MKRLYAPFIAAAALVIIAACVTPTDVCGCVAAPSVLRVSGTVRDARDQPIANARVSILNQPVGFPGDPFSTAGQPWYGTDSRGNFVAETASPTPGRYEIRGRVVRQSGSDTVALVLGVGELRPPAGRVDTLRVAVVVP